MKTKMLKSIIALNIALFIGLQLYAKKSEEVRKDIHKEFIVNSDVMLLVENKFGEVKITTGTSDKVVIDVHIIVKARTEDKARQRLKQFDISISGTPEKVSAITKITGNMKNYNSDDFQINYNIKMPVSGNIDVTNKFGDFYINEINGSSKVYVAYGSFYAQKLNSKINDVTVKFGKADVGYALYMDFVSRYSDIRIKKVKLLELDTQYGNAVVDAAGRLILTSAYDNVELGAIAELIATNKFANLEVEAITIKLEVKNSYGDVEIDFISKEFESVNISSSFADVDLTFEEGTNFIFDGTAKYGDISLPGDVTIRKSEGNTSESYNGKLYEGKTLSTVTIKASYGDISIDID